VKLYEAILPVVSVTLTGTYDDGVIRLDGPVDLEANTKVRVTVEPVPRPQHGRSFLETALELQVVGPSDWATNLERYLHGPLAADE
jgi:hypothetical protein